MFILESKTEIGIYIFNSPHEIEIIKSVEELSDTAIIKLPTNFKISGTDVKQFTEERIKVGDKVSITLGYQGQYSGEEFVGYVKKISPKIPLEIHCEDKMWLLRRKNILWSKDKTTLKEILQEVVKDTPIELANNIPDVPLEKWIIKNANGCQVLESIKKDLLMTAFIDDQGKLYCGLQQLTNIGQSVVYDLNKNLVSNDLEFKFKEDRRIKIEYEYINPKTNKRDVVEVGDADGEKRSFKTSKVASKVLREQMANAELKLLKYDGFDGDVTSFLIPFATRGMKAIIKDKDHKNRQGNYFIKKVVTTFGTGGARRKISISNKL